MKLIIVEGIPGSGKSTTARFIALQLERNGLKAKLFHESTFQHPILIENDIHHPDTWKNTYLENWNHFLEEQMHSDSIFVMESVLFQSPIIHLLHLDVNQDEIIQFINQLYGVLTNMNCSLIYLYQEDPFIGINRMMAARGGETWLENTYEKYKHDPYYVNRGLTGKELHLHFLQEYSSIAHTAFANHRLNSLKIDNTNWDWSLYHKRVLNFLNMSYFPDPVVTPSELEKFVGVFQNKEMGLKIQIELQDHELVIFGDQRLKPKESNQFYLDNISMTLEYIANSRGEFSSLLINEKDLVGNRKDEGTRFVKLE